MNLLSKLNLNVRIQFKSNEPTLNSNEAIKIKIESN
jgi:hypothetical protein